MLTIYHIQFVNLIIFFRSYVKLGIHILEVIRRFYDIIWYFSENTERKKLLIFL